MIADLFNTPQSYRLYTILCGKEALSDCILWLQDQQIEPVNMGKALAEYINTLEDFSFIHIDVYDQVNSILNGRLLDKKNNRAVALAVYNLGMMFEPALGLDPIKILKEVSKAIPLIIIWENEIDSTNRLYWATQQKSDFLDFGEMPIKILPYAI